MRIIAILTMLIVTSSIQALTLTFTDHEPLGNMRTQVIEQFFRLVEQESKGRIKIDDHWNGEISSSYDAYETVHEGKKADMATVVPEYDSKRMPLHQLFKGFLAGPSGEAQVALIRKAYKTVPELTEELHRAGIHPVLVAMNLDRWKSLPEKDKRAFERAADKAYKPMGKTMDESYGQMLRDLESEGCTVRRLTHEEVSDFVNNVHQSEVQEQWVNQKGSEGISQVRRVFEKLHALVIESTK